MKPIKGKYYGGGAKKKPYLEQKIMIYGFVKRMYAKEVQGLINQLVKPYR